MNDCIQPRYAAGVRCAALTVVARSTHRRRLAGPPPGDWLAKSTTYNGLLWAMMTRSSGSQGSIWPLRSCSLAVVENPILLLLNSWASATFLARSVRQGEKRELDTTEETEVVLVPLASIKDLIARGEITHALVIAAFSFLHAYNPPPEFQHRGQ